MPAKKPVLDKEIVRELRHLTKESTDLARESKQLAKENRALAKEIHRLKGLEFVKVLKHPWKLMGLSFLKGAMVGFGTIVGAGILISVFFFIISKISFVPVIGEFIEEVVGQIELPQEVNGK